MAACNPKYPISYCVASSDHQSDLAQIVSKEDEDADQPLIGEVAEGDQNGRKSMVKSILVEVALSSDEDMIEKAPKVLAKLNYIEDLHLKSGLWKGKAVFWKRLGDAFSSKPAWQILALLQNLVSPGRATDIVDHRVPPLYESLASFSPGLKIIIFLLVYVVLLAKLIKDTMDDPVNDLI